MGLFDIIGELAEIPFRVAQIPTQIIKVADECTLETGIGEALDTLNEETVGSVGRAIKNGIKEMDL